MGAVGGGAALTGPDPIMHAYWHPVRLRYDGSQMAPQWATRAFDLVGDSIVSFEGPCRVPPSKMLDLEDLLAGAAIRGPHMLHWIIEHFDRDLERAVLRQRLFAAIVKDEVERRSSRRLERRGDDLYDGRRKLSISIAAPTLVSCKIHFAVNVRRAAGVGVPTEGISAWKILPEELAVAASRAYAQEIRSAAEAGWKVRGVP